MHTIPSEITYADIKQHIYIKDARMNNLKGIDVIIPKNKLVVVTGVSGSGKSSLVMDTLYAEGQRRYVESLSSYARQFLSRMKKPDVEYIKGISPAIAIEQKVTTGNARSTVGSMTEIYDYLRLLYARIGKTISPISGQEVRRHHVSDVIDYLDAIEDGRKVMLYTHIPRNTDRTLRQELQLLLQKGYTRINIHNKTTYIEDAIEEDNPHLDKMSSDEELPEYRLLIDRFVTDGSDENRKRMADSVQTAFLEGEGECILDVIDGDTVTYNNRFELDGMTFLEPTHNLFNYNNPYGACPNCEGYGQSIGLDPDKVIPDQRKTIYEGAIACWNGEKSRVWLNALIAASEGVGIPIHRPYRDLDPIHKSMIWEGTPQFSGILDFFRDLESAKYKIQNRILLARYRGKTTCVECGGSRLRKEASYVKVGGKSIGELTTMPISTLLTFFLSLELEDNDAIIAERIITEVTSRLTVMSEIGLSYLTLERISSTLSGGETQRINLTRILGSNLTNSLYILDEPSIGLHPRDTTKLVAVLERLRDLKNTVIVVEHEEEVIRASDILIDIGPRAGIFGGELVYAGSLEDGESFGESLTMDYIKGKRQIPLPIHRRSQVNHIRLHGVSKHNLKNIDVTIPLQNLVVISGVSGSGKTTLVKHILYPALKDIVEHGTPASGQGCDVDGDFSQITDVELINQSPIGKSSRSNPITYVKAYDSIRSLFSKQQLSKIRGYKPKHFSFNVDGGRCDTCKGDGEIIVEMQFLSDVKLVCDDCQGRRFKKEILEVTYKGKNIYEVLDMSIDEAIEFFSATKDLVTKIKPLQDVGLGYVKLGQSSSTLSGGEAQRVKLASYLAKEKRDKKKIFFIFDEPTTGLHFHDILKLMDALNALVERGHTVLVVEHNLEVIKNADWLIDLGPEGGEDGGHLLYEGPPEGILKVKESHTARYLEAHLSTKTSS